MQTPDPSSLKEQYEFFKSVYSEQYDRRKSLESRAQLFFTIQSVYFGVVTLKISDVLSGGGIGPAKMAADFFFFQIGVISSLAAAIFFTLWSVRIREYQTVCSPEEVARDLLDDEFQPMTDFQFFRERIVDLSMAATWNMAKNWEAGKSLYFATVFMQHAPGTEYR